MRTTQLPYEVEALLKKDFHTVCKKIEDILVGGKGNHMILSPTYLTPLVENTMTVPRTEERGEYHHYRKVRNVVEYLFEHEGTIREKYRHMLQEIHAPSYIMALIS